MGNRAMEKAAEQVLVTALNGLVIEGKLEKILKSESASPALADVNKLLAQGVAIAAAAKLLARNLNRPEGNLVQSLQAEVNQEMQTGTGFDQALEQAKGTLSRRVFSGIA